MTLITRVAMGCFSNDVDNRQISSTTQSTIAHAQHFKTEARLFFFFFAPFLVVFLTSFMTSLAFWYRLLPVYHAPATCRYDGLCHRLPVKSLSLQSTQPIWDPLHFPQPSFGHLTWIRCDVGSDTRLQIVAPGRLQILAPGRL